MTDYDPNLPQEFAHMPKKRGLGLGAIMLVMALIAVFVLGALLATLRHQTPSAERTAGAPAATQVEADGGADAPASAPASGE